MVLKFVKLKKGLDGYYNQATNGHKEKYLKDILRIPSISSESFYLVSTTAVMTKKIT